MKRTAPFVLLLILLAILCGYLLSAISLVGKVGISLLHTEYQFLKTWWKGAALVLIVWLCWLLLHHFFRKKMTGVTMHLLHTVTLVVALAGLYLSYSDFRNTLSHRWLGERFHLGVYLFWLGLIAITIFSWLKKGTAITMTQGIQRQTEILPEKQ